MSFTVDYTSLSSSMKDANHIARGVMQGRFTPQPALVDNLRQSEPPVEGDE